MRRVVAVFGFLSSTASLASSPGAGEMAAALSMGGSWGGTTLGLARSLFPLMLMVAIVVELVFRDPAQPASMRGPLWRALTVFVLLVNVSPPNSRASTMYGWSAFGLAGLSDQLTTSLAPGDVWAEFKAVNEKWQTELNDSVRKGEVGKVDGIAAAVGGMLFSSLIRLALLVGQGAMWVVLELAKALAILLYAVGPLALVFSIPRVSDSFQRWLRTFITILAWPVISALLMAIISKAGLDGLKGLSPAFGSIATALLLSVTACAVPIVSSSLVGGSLGAVGSGMASLLQATSTVGGLTSVVGLAGGGQRIGAGAGSAVGAPTAQTAAATPHPGAGVG